VGLTTIGHLDGGFEAWKKAEKEIDTVDRITAEEFAEEVKIGESSSTSVKTVNIVQNMLKMPLASLWLV
jgi:3-mercaptopyruvate sulfurtransferase SseA